MGTGPDTPLASEPTTLGALVDPDWLRAFGRHLWRHFREDRCFEAAGVLSYTTLLALVPLMAVMFGVISAFPVFDRWATELQNYIFSNFVPATGDVVRDYLDQFVARTGQLTGAGTVFLIITAILLMASIEKSLNRIWRVQTPRHPGSRLLVYWSVLTLGPLLMGASLAMTSYLTALPLLGLEVVRGWLQGLVLDLAPFLVALAAFALIFIVVPNRRVRWRHALMGALISALLFEIAKTGFVWYVTRFPTYERLYGALAAVPLFLVWIYISWVVVLLGASVAAALTTFRYRRAPWRWNPRHELLLALRLLGHFWQAQRRGQSLSSSKLLAREPAATDAQIQRLLSAMRQARLVQNDTDGDWFLSADLDNVTLADLYDTVPFVLPLTELDDMPRENHWDRALIEALQAVQRGSGHLFDRSLKSYLASEESSG